MLLKQANGLQWLEFEQLQAYPLKQAIFLRPYDLGNHSPKLEQNIVQIRHSLSAPHIMWSLPCHQDQWVEITAGMPNNLSGDIMITKEKNNGILIRHADCQAAIIYDPEHHLVANIHCGWRGNVLNVYGKAIAHLQEAYASDPSKLLVCISPSLGPQYAEFKNYQQEFPPEFWQFQHKPCYFDLWAISTWQLQNSGILPQHIEIAQQCTYANAQDFFSYRRDKTTARNGTVVMLL